MKDMLLNFEFPNDEMAYTLIKDYDLPVLQYFFNKEEVIEYLKYYQKWRRNSCGEYLAPPDSATLGLIIDEAIRLLILGSGSEDKASNKIINKQQKNKQMEKIRKHCKS